MTLNALVKTLKYLWCGFQKHLGNVIARAQLHLNWVLREDFADEAP